MAVKIVRQTDSIALLGVPTSAAAMSAGHEAAPGALRSAGLIDRLKSIGYQVTDLGDDSPRLFKPDDESPRARNLPSVIAMLETLKPRVEQAVKSGALPLILSGDCSVALAVIAGARRYYRNLGLIYMDRDADLNTPATTPSGCVDGMVVAHLTGHGAAELVRFWGEPPLVREPDLALFGVDRLDPSEDESLRRAPLRRYMAVDVKRKGASATAHEAVERVHGNTHEFVLHFDVDVISDFAATNYPGSGGLTLEDVREALEVFTQEKNLAAIEVTAYNPAKDADGSCAKVLLDLLAGALEKRLETLKTSNVAAAAAKAMEVGAEASNTEGTPSIEGHIEPTPQTPTVSTGEAWSSDSLDENHGEAAGSSDGRENTANPESSSRPETTTPDEAAAEGERPHESGESQN